MSTITIEPSDSRAHARSATTRRWLACALAIAPAAVTATSFAAPTATAPIASASTSISATTSASTSASTTTPTATTSASATTSATTTTVDGEVPSDGGTLTLDNALSIFHKRGFDILLADASIYSAEGVELAAGYHINPTMTGGVGRAFGYDPSQACGTDATGAPLSCGASAYQFLIGLSDNGEIIENLVGKRPLRLKVARAALQAAKTTKLDTLRTLDGQLKQAYTQLALTIELFDLSKEIQKASIKTLELNKLRYPAVIDEGALARIETAKLEADAGVDLAEQAVSNARAGVAYLLGVRSVVPKFITPKSTLDYRIPSALSAATEDSLIHDAFTHRPDLAALGFQRERADAAIELARRLRYPDVSLGLQYTQTGTGQSALSPPTLFFTISATLPTFYSQEGEIQQAKADSLTQSLAAKKLEAQIVSDVETGWAIFKSSRSLVERMESATIERATVARDIVEKQYKAGAQGITLTDFLDAYRTWIGTKQEYLNDKQNYWSAVYQLEQAVGMELGK
ncbi:MAG: TolC family protein [Polyangiales bacterium]